MTRRLAAPAGLALAALTLLLPFASFRMELPANDGEPALRWEVTYTGLAPAVNQPPQVSISPRPDDWAPSGQDGDEVFPERVDDSALGSRAFTLLTLALLAVGLVASTLPAQRVRATLSAAAALLAGLALLAATLRVQQTLSAYSDELLGPGNEELGLVTFRYGFWLATGLLAVVGFTNVALAVPGPTRPEPAAVSVNPGGGRTSTDVQDSPGA